MARVRVTPKENKPVIELVDLVKQFGNKTVLKDLNLSINKGEFITLLGASGSGKTTLLRLIGGFDWPTRGEIKFYGVDVKDLPAHKRPTNTIFQDYALFPHLNVEGNIKYGLKLSRVEKNNIPLQFEKKLETLREKWNIKATEKMKRLDVEQKGYEKIISETKKDSFRYKRALKWLDDTDFKYSYWETYVNEKTENYTNRHIKRKLSRKEMQELSQNIINLVGLEGNEKKSIDELSGGMKQRAALARALVTKPQILLLDEPLSALDLKVRQKMQRELRNIQRTLGLTFIFVTHDQEEAMTISDRVAVMREGKIEQYDKPQRIYEFPANSWVADFIGESNIFSGKVVSKNKIQILGQTFPGDTYNFKKGQKVKIMIRPEDVTLTKGKGFINGTIKTASYLGTFWEYGVKAQKSEWKIQTTKKLNISDKVNFKWTSYDVHSMED